MTRPRSSRHGGELADTLRRWCDQEYFWARANMRLRPVFTHPPGYDPTDWRERVSVNARDLIDLCMRMNIWEPEPHEPGTHARAKPTE